jgi:hypothetical protein
MERDDGRSETRPNVFLSAVLQTRNNSSPVRIRNISTRGALIQGLELPRATESVRLIRANLSVSGEIAWQSDRFAGIRFKRAVRVPDWIAGTANAGQQRVDTIVAAIRDSDSFEESAEPEQKRSLEAISFELDRACERLAALPDFSVELGEEILRLGALAVDLRRICEKGEA